MDLRSVPAPRAAAALIDDEPDVLAAATCPMCQTRSSLSHTGVESGSAWRCVRCGQQWEANRLAAVAGYAAWAVGHDHRLGRGTS
jgi:hypothetical protein